MKKTLNIWFFTLLVLISCSQPNSTFAVSATAPDHKIWDELLKKHVRSDGFVDYKGMISEKAKLEKYLALLSSNAPNDSWSKNEKLAYWINVYNAFTVKLIVDNYPLESIKDLNPMISIPTVNTIWAKDWFQIGGEDFSLDRVEHKILRKDFEEPRIHFAVNCASYSCPVLRPEAFTAAKVDKQLEEQAINFINDPKRNQITKDRIDVSKIFSWFGSDFNNGQTLIQFLNKYSKVKIDEDAQVKFMDYGWSLNDASKK
jgi:hypothetical protein